MAQTPVRPIPEGWHRLTPHLICAGASDAIGFYARAFGAVEISRMAAPDGKIVNAQLRIGDSHLMLVDEMPQWGALGPTARGGTPVTLHLYVEDVDAGADPRRHGGDVQQARRLPRRRCQAGLSREGRRCGR